MPQLRRRRALSVLATSSLALIGGFVSLFPEARLLRANAATATLAAPSGRGLRGKAMLPGAFARARTELRTSREGARALAYASAAGFTTRPGDGIGVVVEWTDGQEAGSAILVPLARGARRGMLVRRVTSDGVLVGVAMEDANGWVHVTSSSAGSPLEEAAFQRRADGTFIVRGSDGREQILTSPDAATPAQGRHGLAAPFAADPICTTVCNWVTNLQCATFWVLTTVFVCAWIALDSLGALAIGCALTFVGLAIVTCAAYQDWVCGTLCAW